MKRGIVILILSLVLMSSIVSAGFFTGVWQDYLTGRQVSETTQDGAQLLINGDNGFFIYKNQKRDFVGKEIILESVNSNGAIELLVDSIRRQISLGDIQEVAGLNIRNGYVFYNGKYMIQPQSEVKLIINGNIYTINQAVGKEIGSLGGVMIASNQVAVGSVDAYGATLYVGG